MRQSVSRRCLHSKVALSPLMSQQRFRGTERCCDCMELCRDHFWCVFYKLAVKVITLPFLPPRPFRNHHTMPFSSSRSSKASQWRISHGKLSISADEMATWKTSPNRSPSPSLYLLISRCHPLNFILSLSPPEAEYEMHLCYRRLLRVITISNLWV